MIETNKYQTPLTDSFLQGLPKDVADELVEIVTQVPFVRSLVSPSRKRAADLPRDGEGRVIVDLASPHILEDMDYFRPVALCYERTGKVTDLKPSNDPASPYMIWLREEIRRMWDGYVRESDGEWVTGYMYWYLNYCPIMLSRIREGTNRADRVEAMPEMWEGVYWRFHYIEQAARLGKHCAELASRGKSKSYVLASILSHIFLVGDSRNARKGITGIVTAAQKEYLIKDGVLNKFVRDIDFCSKNTQLPKRRLKSSMAALTWVSGYKIVGTDTEAGSLNTVLGVTSADDESKLRGKRATKILIEEMGCHLKGTRVLMYDGNMRAVEDISEGDLLMGPDSKPRKVLETFSGVDDMYTICLPNGDRQTVNSTHPVYCVRVRKNGAMDPFLTTAPELLKLKSTYGYYIVKATPSFPERETRIDPYLAGMWLVAHDKEKIMRLKLRAEFEGPVDFMLANGWVKEKKRLTGKRWIFLTRPKDDARDKFMDALMDDGFLPPHDGVPYKYRVNSPERQARFLAGALEGRNTYNGKSGVYLIEIRHIPQKTLQGLKFVAECLGFRVILTEGRLSVNGDFSKLPLLSGRTMVNHAFIKRRPRVMYRLNVLPYGKGEFYGFTVDGNHLFLLEDLTIVHNTFPRLLNMYNLLLPSVQEGDVAFGQIIAVGTSGDSESDFAGAREILSNPDGYNMYALRNVYDKPGKGRDKFTFFFPGYINRKGCYNHDGVSDVTKALAEILVNRYNIRKGSTDASTLTRAISEVPITPDEAMMRSAGNMFPAADCNARVAQLDSDAAAYDGVYVGELEYGASGQLTYKPTTDMPLRDYPVTSNFTAGALEIYEMPSKDDQGKVYGGRYIAGADPIDADSADSTSLGSVFVLDLWTDRIVAEYTGKSRYVDDFNEKCRRLCLFYNARLNYENNRKGLFSYFAARNSLFLLTDTLEFLKDKQMAKPGFGNGTKGTVATVTVNAYARNLLRSWLIAPVTIQNKDGTESTVARLFTLMNRALLRELVCYSPFGNFDRVSAMGMLMLLREEKIILYQGNVRSGEENRRAGYLGNDPFFEKNYRRGGW